MKKIIFGLFLYISSYGAHAADCGGLLVSLDELKYMEVEELQRTQCAVPKFMNIFTRMMNMDEMSACMKVTNLTTKVLDREYETVPLTEEECAVKYPSFVD